MISAGNKPAANRCWINFRWAHNYLSKVVWEMRWSRNNNESAHELTSLSSPFFRFPPGELFPSVCARIQRAVLMFVKTNIFLTVFLFLYMHACIDNKHSLNLSYTFTPLARANPLGLAGLFAGLPFELFVGLDVVLCWRSTRPRISWRLLFQIQSHISGVRNQ